MCSNRIRSPCLTSTTSFSLGLISSLYGFINHLLFSSLCVYVVIWIVRASIKQHSRQVKTPKCKRRMQKKTGPKERKKEDKSKIILKTRTESNGKWNICLKCIAFLCEHRTLNRPGLRGISLSVFCDKVYFSSERYCKLQKMLYTSWKYTEIESKWLSHKCELVENIQFSR